MRYLRVPKYVTLYPFSPLVVAKGFTLVCSGLTLAIWHNLAKHSNDDAMLRGVAVCVLLSVMFTAISLWFLLDKFFWVKVDVGLTLASLMFTCAGIICTFKVNVIAYTNDHYYVLICHFYLVIALTFNLVSSIACTENVVSRLFIPNWGDSVSVSEVAYLNVDF